MHNVDRLQLEACRNARLMTRVCDLLEGGGPAPDPTTSGALEEIRSEIYKERELFMRDYDPDVDGWPWETPYL